MKITAIFSSPRKGGNSCSLGMAAIEGAMGLSTNIIQIRRLNSLIPSRGCQHCNRCKETGMCVQNDDLARIVEDIKQSDALILCIPMYFGRPCATYCSLEDRLYSLLDTDLTSKIPKGKKLITIVTCAKDVARGEQLVRDLEIVYCNMLGFESLGSLVYASGAEVSASKDHVAQSRALELGRKLNPNADLERTYYNSSV